MYKSSSVKFIEQIICISLGFGSSNLGLKPVIHYCGSLGIQMKTFSELHKRIEQIDLLNVVIHFFLIHTGQNLMNTPIAQMDNEKCRYHAIVLFVLYFLLPMDHWNPVTQNQLYQTQ